MLTNNQEKRLWIMEETGGCFPVRKAEDIENRPRGRGIPDWWVVARDKSWRPPAPVSLLSPGAADSLTAEDEPATSPAEDDDAEPGTGKAGGGADMKIGAGHKLQAYDEHGRYTGPHGAEYNRNTGQIRFFNGRSMLAEAGEGGEEETADETGQQEQAEEQPVEDALEAVLVSYQPQGEAERGWNNEEQRLEEKKFTPERLVTNARADIGSDKWSPTKENGETKNHCNEFVASKLRESGAHVPNVGGRSGALGEETSDRLHEMSGGRIGGQTPSANDWHKGNVPGYEKVENPRPGDVATDGVHAGIVSGEATTTSVSSKTGRVVENDWGFRTGQSDVTFWRYKRI